MTERFNRPALAFGLRRKKAFSLVEIVIAIAVTTFCIATIVTLLPVGLHTALNSRSQTRAAYLAEQIISDLRSSSFTNAAVLYPNPLNGNALSALTSIDLSKASTNYLICDNGNNVLSSPATSNQYAMGITDTAGNYLVQITVVPAALAKISSVSVEISTPAQAALNSRLRYGFQTMIGNRQ
jgi:uncharacterized protein (TIGR02598 family)